MTSKKQKTIEVLEKEYKTTLPTASFFLDELERQVIFLLKHAKVILGVPVEKRIKEWSSITQNINENEKTNIHFELPDDLIGLRIILLFQRDVEKVCQIVKSKFTIIKEVDKKATLLEREFGYSSIHYVIKQPPEWKQVPTLGTSADLQAEIQVRTLAQHIWAAASHSLQYKKENSVPPIARRSINRVAALLETVDLEFERALGLRETYISSIGKSTISIGDNPLNVDLLKKLLDYWLPSKNKRGNENYSELLSDLMEFKVNTSGKLKQIIEKNKSSVMKMDKKMVTKRKREKFFAGTTPERIANGVFYTHVGLTRLLLRLEFGEKFIKYRMEKNKKNTFVSKHKKSKKKKQEV